MKLRFLAILAALLLLLHTAGCASAAAPPAPNRIEEDPAIRITTQEVAALFAKEYGDEPLTEKTLKRNKVFLLVDTRPPARFAEGTVPGSVNIPPSRFTRDIPGLPRERTIVFYGDGVSCPFTTEAAVVARANGFTDVRAWYEGEPGWSQAGNYLITSTAHVRQLVEHGDKENFVLIDSRPHRVHRNAFIPGSVSVPWALFAQKKGQLPADKGMPLIFYSAGHPYHLSHKAARAALELGYGRVYVYAAGVAAWEKEGYPLWGNEGSGVVAAPQADHMEFVALPGGCFSMGDSFGDGEEDEKPAHRVCLAGFSMGKYAVTVGQFRIFIDATGYRTDAENGGGCFTLSQDGQWSWHFLANWRTPGFSQTDKHPAVCVSWNDAAEYAKWLSNQGGKTHRLPTEAEWEYAARGGTAGRNYWGDRAEDACRYANVSDLTVKRSFPERKVHECDDGHLYTSPVGSYIPNDFGLYDMMGNVWQWTGDWYGKNYYQESPRDNPQGPAFGQRRVPRGGSWLSNPKHVRVSLRIHPPPSQTAGVGFRLVSPLP